MSRWRRCETWQLKHCWKEQLSELILHSQSCFTRQVQFNRAFDLHVGLQVMGQLAMHCLTSASAPSGSLHGGHLVFVTCQNLLYMKCRRRGLLRSRRRP